MNDCSEEKDKRSDEVNIWAVVDWVDEDMGIQMCADLFVSLLCLLTFPLASVFTTACLSTALPSLQLNYYLSSWKIYIIQIQILAEREEVSKNSATLFSLVLLLFGLPYYYFFLVLFFLLKWKRRGFKVIRGNIRKKSDLLCVYSLNSYSTSFGVVFLLFMHLFFHSEEGKRKKRRVLCFPFHVCQSKSKLMRYEGKSKQRKNIGKRRAKYKSNVFSFFLSLSPYPSIFFSCFTIGISVFLLWSYVGGSGDYQLW